MKGHIAQRYGELVKDMWSGSTKTTAPLKLRVMLMPKYVHLVIRKPDFAPCKQQSCRPACAFLQSSLPGLLLFVL